MGNRGTGARTAATAAAALLLAGGCGHSGSSKAEKGDPPPARVTGSFSEDQLKTMLLTDADVPGTTINRDEESTTVAATEDGRVSSGGGGCQKFVTATELVASVYGTAAQANRDLLGANDEATRYDLTLAMVPGNGAAQVLSDLRAGLAACSGSFTIPLDFGTASYTDKEIKVDPAGDSAFGYVETSGMAHDAPATVYNEFVQVGPVVIRVRVFPMEPGHGDPAQLPTQLAAVVKAQVARLTQGAAP